MAFTIHSATNHLYTSGTNLTVSRTVNAAATMLIVVISRRAASNTSSMTYGGQAMTLVSSSRSGGSVGLRTEIYYLMNPPTGANDLVVTPAGSGDDFRAGVIDVSGGDTSGTPAGAAKTGASGNGSVTINSVPDDALIVAGLVHEDGSAPTTPTNYTAIHNTDEGTWATGAARRALTGGAGNHTVTWGGGLDDDFAASAAYFQIAATDKQINVNDAVTLAEFVAVEIAVPPLILSVNDTVLVEEFVKATHVLTIHAGVFKGVQIVTPP